MADGDTCERESIPLPERPKPPRRVQRFEVMFWIVVALIIGPQLWLLWTGAVRIRFEGAWIASFAMLALGLGAIRYFFRQRLAREFLRPFAGFICPRCHYPLSRLPDGGTCPECGTWYTREAVVSLWETSYGIKRRFPRSGAPRRPLAEEPTAAAPHVPPPLRAVSPSAPAAPWKNASMKEALDGVERVARAHGFASMRVPIYAEAIEHNVAGLRWPLPIDLFLFLSWIDPALWASFTGFTPKDSFPHDWTGAAAGASEPDDTLLVLHEPSRLRACTVEEAGATDPLIARFLENLGALERADDWRSARLFEFASTARGDRVFLCTGVAGPRGAIVATFRPDRVDRVWLADSLGHWLARLGACDGVEFAFAPHRLAEAPPELRAAYEREFNEHNPSPSQ